MNVSHPAIIVKKTAMENQIPNAISKYHENITLDKEYTFVLQNDK